MRTDSPKIKIKRGRAITITAPCVIVLPEDSRQTSILVHVLLVGDGKIHHHKAPIDDRPRKAR